MLLWIETSPSSGFRMTMYLLGMASASRGRRTGAGSSLRWRVEGRARPRGMTARIRESFIVERFVGGYWDLFDLVRISGLVIVLEQ